MASLKAKFKGLTYVVRASKGIESGFLRDDELFGEPGSSVF
jgi:hypothetical protein